MFTKYHYLPFFGYIVRIAQIYVLLDRINFREGYLFTINYHFSGTLYALLQSMFYSIEIISGKVDDDEIIEELGGKKNNIRTITHDLDSQFNTKVRLRP